MRNAKNTNAIHATLSKMRLDSKQLAIKVQEAAIEAQSEYRIGDKVWVKKVNDIYWRPGVVVNLANGEVYAIAGDKVRVYSTRARYPQCFGQSYIECVRRDSDQMPAICRKISQHCLEYDCTRGIRATHAVNYIKNLPK